MSFVSYESVITLFVVEEEKQENTPNRKDFHVSKICVTLCVLSAGKCVGNFK
jgi:hypothetical protein